MHNYSEKSILYYVNTKTHNRHELDLNKFMPICVSVKCFSERLTHVGLKNNHDVF